MTRNLAQLITCTPRVFDQVQADETAARFSGLAPELVALLAGTASTSPYLKGLMEKEQAWLENAVHDPSGAAQTVIATAAAMETNLATGLREGKRRIALLTALADLGGAWDLQTVTGTLTRFADAACNAALRAGLAPLIRRGKVPGMTEDDLADACGMVVLAMGKMGAGELNFSSDIDLICLFDETRHAADDFLEVRTAFVKATRSMSGTLSEMTGDGYVFRTDLRLRPDPAVTPVCMAMEAAERYYESLGRTWERAAYIKARPAAGDLKAGERFLAALVPFVWRKHLDFAAIQDAHDMRLAIREHKRLGGSITLPGHNMKLGRGGIREIEFFTQTRQLIAGGRDSDLRLRGTLEGLTVLARKGWVDAAVAARLQDHYVAHRTVEHRLQMVRDAQTHDLPATAEGFERLAAMMDRDVAALKSDLQDRLSDVHDLTEGFFAGGKARPANGHIAHAFDPRVMDRWPSYPALRSARALELFERLKPDLLSRLSTAARPDEALLAFDGFLAGLPAGVQLFSLLKANPQLADLLIDIVSTSPALAAHLSRNASVFDAVIGGDFFSTWPGRENLRDALTQVLAAETDYEAQLDATRRWAKEWHFRIGVHLLRGLSSADAAGRQYADLACAVLTALWPVVMDQFAKRHGRAPGRGAVILGMGSLGSGRLTATSDLDVLVIYDAQGQEVSDGPRPLATRTYFARLTQAMITAMTAPMAQGKLYEIDMRLRPSGNQGPVATNIASFESYQMNEAWIWEHLALTRAEVVAGPEDLAGDVRALRDAILAKPRNREEVLQGLVDMRSRIAEAKPQEGPLDAKIGAGRLQDIELLAQAGALLAGTAAPEIADGLRAARETEIVGPEASQALQSAYERFWVLQCASRLLSANVLQAEELGRAERAFICRVLGAEDLARAVADVTDASTAAAAAIDGAVGQLDRGG